MQRELLAAARTALDSMRGGRPVVAENLHVTLAFLGSVPEASLEAVKECARMASEESRVAPPGLDVTLDALDYWRRSRVLCAVPSREPAGAAELADGLKRALCAAGFTPDLKPFRAHVTLARRVGRGAAGMLPSPAGGGGAPAAIREAAGASPRFPPVLWRFSEFSLAESRTGSVGSTYSVLGAWPLCGS
jgi:RNA 2',3'-cyclic 3'-phosphodiesterase